MRRVSTTFKFLRLPFCTLLVGLYAAGASARAEPVLAPGQIRDYTMRLMWHAQLGSFWCGVRAPSWPDNCKRVENAFNFNGLSRWTGNAMS
jgi:hypothetical protein